MADLVNSGISDKGDCEIPDCIVKTIQNRLHMKNEVFISYTIQYVRGTNKSLSDDRHKA